MSDIYLTKVERKTIFTQGLIYVLFTFVIADLTVTGPYAFCMLPWLFFLGIMGVNKFYHPIMTVLLSTFTTFMASLFKYHGLGMGVLTSTLVTFIMTTAGLVVGICIREFVLEHRLVKQLSVHKKILNIVVMTFLTLGAILVYSAKYGNIVGYIQSRIELKKYMTETLESSNYEIQALQFLEGTFGDYLYEIKNGEDILNLKVTSKVELMNFNDIKEANQDSLDTKFKQNFKFNYISVKLNYEYNENEVRPIRLVAAIVVNTEEKVQEDIAVQVVSEIKQVCKFKDKFGNIPARIMLSLDGGIQIIEQDRFDEISEEYIKNSMTIETFDMY